MGKALDLGIEATTLHLEVLVVFELGGDDDLEWAGEFATHHFEPGTVFFGPQ